MIGLLILLLCATSVVLALYLAREMGRRNAAEASLAVLATTDGLTGLSNRRYLQRGHRPRVAARHARSHVAGAGDVRCRSVQDLQRSPRASGRRPAVAGDRHGDETEHPARQPTSRRATAATNSRSCCRRRRPMAARRIAGQVREPLAPRLCDELGIARSQLSIGVAALVPEPGEDQAVADGRRGPGAVPGQGAWPRPDRGRGRPARSSRCWSRVQNCTARRRAADCRCASSDACRVIALSCRRPG